MRKRGFLRFLWKSFKLKWKKINRDPQRLFLHITIVSKLLILTSLRVQNLKIFRGFAPALPSWIFCLLRLLNSSPRCARSIIFDLLRSFFLTNLMPANISRDRFSNSNCYLIFFKFDFPIRKWENQSFTIELETGSETFLFFNFKIVT